MMKPVGIIGLGKYLPKRVLTNKQLEKMVDTTDEWIFTRTGIKERRLADKNESTSDLAIPAARDALKDAKLKAESVELIIAATVTPDMQFPSVSCLIQRELGAKKAACFDMSAACAGFVYGLITARQFVASGMYKNALVVAAEKTSSFVDWKDRSTCILFGDGSGAAVVGPVKRPGFLSAHLGADGRGADLLMVAAGGSRYPPSRETLEKKMHYVKMRGNELFRVAVGIMADAALKALEQAGLSCQDVDCFIPHQANARIIYATAKKLGLSKDKIFMNIEKYGNMSAASSAVALCEAVKSGRIKKGDIVLLDTFGAGLAWGSCVIKW